MESSVDHHNPELSLIPCQCSLCIRQLSKSILIARSIGDTTNFFGEYLKKLPSNFPLFIEQTIVVNKQQNNKQLHLYSNLSQQQKSKWNIMNYQLKGLHSIISQNFIVYFKNQQKIMTKYQASSLLSNNKCQILYVQPYQVDSSISILYPFNLKEKLDNVICEYLKSQENKILNDNYKINEESLEWIYKQYGQQTFYHYLTQFYARIFKILTKGQIKAGLFFWTSQKKKFSYLNVQTKGSQRELYNSMVMAGLPRKIQFKPKLINIKGLQIKEFQKLVSFDEQYQGMIKMKIQGSTKKAISSIKKQAYRNRIEHFQNKLQQFYKKQQKATMDGIQKEKKYEFEVDSQKIAQLLIPNMAPYKNLREVLNSQQAFRQVFMKKRNKRIVTEDSSLVNKKAKDMCLSVKKDIKKKEQTPLLWRTTTKYNISSSVMEKKYKKLITTPSTAQ